MGKEMLFVFKHPLLNGACSILLLHFYLLSTTTTIPVSISEIRAIALKKLGTPPKYRKCLPYPQNGYQYHGIYVRQLRILKGPVCFRE
jgi:hypothetical protein